MRKIAIITICLSLLSTIAYGQNVGINTTGDVGHESAGLDVDFDDKGFLIPRVALTETTNENPVTNPETSLMVYNTAEINDVSPGYYYWDGAIWRKLAETGHYWKIKGNDNTTEGTHFLGTTHNDGVDFRTNDLLRMRMHANGQIVAGNPDPFLNSTLSAYSTDNNVSIGAENDGTGMGVRTHNTGNGWGLVSLSFGTGNAIQAQNVSSSGNAFRGVINDAGSGMIFSGTNNGTGRVAGLLGNNVTSGATTVLVNNNGLGRTCGFQSNNANNDRQVVFVSQNGVGTEEGATGVWSQSQSIASGVFIASLQNNETTVINANYNGGGAFDATAVYAAAQPDDGFGVGGHFRGNERGVVGVAGPGATSGVHAIGDLTATGVKPFEIDHPLDPENKTLRHFAIESSEVLNHYRGNVELDSEGTAEVELPNYFETININFSYNLTAVGAPAPNLHVSREIEGNTFEISGGEPGMKVSWSVEAERNDMYLQTYPERRTTEVDKKEKHKGKYFDPAAYGLPQSIGVFKPNGREAIEDEKFDDKKESNGDIKH